MRLFVCEYITGGGMRNQNLPESLLNEGDAMLRALLLDLSEVDGIELTTTRDDRLDNMFVSVANIGNDDNVWDVWYSCMKASDASWIIAPETEGILARLRNMASSAGCLFIGCDHETIVVTSSKAATAKHLSNYGIPSIDTFYIYEEFPHSNIGWVIKPDDGAGTEECFFFDELSQVVDWRSKYSGERKFVIQEYIDGIAASISASYYNGRVLLLSCNKQLFKFVDGVGKHQGIIVNGMKEEFDSFYTIAVDIGKALPHLCGYIGIDLLVTDSGPVVVEINPRLTTSYVGLRESLQINIADLILRQINNDELPVIPSNQYAVSVNL